MAFRLDTGNTEKMDTKQRILREALTLFSEKGYDAVFVSEIAGAVGIKAPSLYKHYPNKQEIFDSCVREFSHRMEHLHETIGMPDARNPQFRYETVSEEKLCEVAQTLFSFYLLDEVASKFRKLLLLERYRNQSLNTLFETLFIDGAIAHETNLFAKLIDKGALHGATAEQMALRFYAPVFFLLQKYDMRHQELDRANEELRQSVAEFCKTYGERGQ